MISRMRNKIKRDGIFSFSVAVIKYPFGVRRRLAYKNMLNLNSAKDRFSEIYEHNLWSSAESGSGEGSEIFYTAPLRQWLIENINSLDIKTFVDAPCGDFNWMKLVLPQVDINYIGLDIVEGVIEKNKAKHASDKICFGTANICEDELPDCDIIMVRDCLFHFCYEDINSFLVNLSKTNYKYLLTTTHKVDKYFENLDITTGDFRLIDLFSDPFCFDAENINARVDDFPAGYSIKREMILVEKRFVPTQLVRFSRDVAET
jgi:hypothetical protein